MKTGSPAERLFPEIIAGSLFEGGELRRDQASSQSALRDLS